MKKNILIWCSIILIFCLSVGLFWYSYVSFLRPARLNALYNHILSSITKYDELIGYTVCDEYSWDSNSFSVPLSKGKTKDKLIVVSTNLLSQIKGIKVIDLSDDISFIPVENDMVLNSIKVFNSVFTYTNISNFNVSELGSQIVNFISSEALNDIDVDVVDKEVVMSFKANLVALFNYNKANLKEGVVLEELTSYDVFCDRLLSYDYYYDMNDKCIVLSIVFDYKVNHEHLKIYFKDGVISCE